MTVDLAYSLVVRNGCGGQKLCRPAAKYCRMANFT